MATKPMRYAELQPFLVWWVAQFDRGVLGTPDALAESLSVERLPYSEFMHWTTWSDHVTAFRRLRQDARLRVCRRFLDESRR